MFKNLRNKLLLINIIAILGIMITSFIATFIITYTNVARDVSSQLQATLNQNYQGPGSSELQFDQPFDNDKDMLRLPNFWVEINTRSNTVLIHQASFINNDQVNNVIISLVDTALNQNNYEGYFRNNNYYYAYLKIPTVNWL